VTAAFLDTNVLVYAHSLDLRAERARHLLQQPYVIGVQTLNEYAFVARRKLRREWVIIIDDVTMLAANAEIVLATEFVDHQRALQLASKRPLAPFDALMLALALRAGCTTFYSEDMQDGLVVDGRLTIINPFP
jgi:predicted nucleic acid-binding protein